MKKLLYLIFFISSISYSQKTIVIAHRGGAGMAPENTLSAFNKAVEVNADFFELDVQLSSDDSLIIMHDGSVNRTTNGTGNVSSLSYAQIKELDAGSWFGVEFTGEKVPTLYESLLVAKNSPNNIGVVIEIKSADAKVPALIVSLVQKMNMEDRVIVSSFSFATISSVKTLDPTIPVQLFGTITNGLIDQVESINGDWVGSGGPFTQAVIDYAHIRGVSFNAWTLNSAVSMQPAIDLGVDGITTDYPLVLIALMDETPPSDVVLTSATPDETRVTLVWEAASDDDTGIAGYDIYRDETPGAVTLLASVGKVTEYMDDTHMELTPFYYRIKARNAGGKMSANYSNEIAITTLGDATPPQLSFINSRGDSSYLVVGFSEEVDKTLAETNTNYSLSNGATVLTAKLARDLKSVILTTSPMSEQSYLLTVKNVTDKANIPNIMVTENKTFFHYRIPDSAVLYYKLDSLFTVGEDIKVLDETQNMNNGMVLNGVYLTEGILGDAIGFDGVDDYIQIPNSTSLDINAEAVTVSLWTKLDYAPLDLPVAYGPLYDSETDQYVLYEDRGNNELRFKVVTSAKAERPGIPGADIKKGEWIHVVGVYDGTNAMIYLNGEMKDSHPITGTVKTGQVATLGKSGASFFSGSIDQVEVYNRALSEEEIRMIYNTTTQTVNTVNVEVSHSGASLTAAASGAEYRWLDCGNDYAVVTGETAQTFNVTTTGNYAVEVTLNGYVDTSACILVDLTGLNPSKAFSFNVFPNPNSGNFTLEFDRLSEEEMRVEVINFSGKIIYDKEIGESTLTKIDLPSAKAGIYIIRISSGSESIEHRMVIL